MVAAWLCMDAGFFLAAYAADCLQYPNPIAVYTGFALCFAAPHIDKHISEQKELEEQEKAVEKADAETNNML